MIRMADLSILICMKLVLLSGMTININIIGLKEELMKFPRYQRSLSIAMISHSYLSMSTG